jgi:hypothetical protein
MGKGAFKMKKMNTVRFISIGGILTTIAVIFQTAPVFLPAIGLALSPFSTLPLALAAYFNISLGITVLFSSVLILTFVSVQEALILLFTTGLLGIVIGLLYKKGLFVSILYSAITLSISMIILTYIMGISVFGDFTGSLSIPITLIIFILFSLIYAGIWNICLKKFVHYLIKIRVLN